MERPDFKRIAESFNYTDESLTEFVARVWKMSEDWSKDVAEVNRIEKESDRDSEIIKLKAEINDLKTEAVRVAHNEVGVNVENWKRRAEKAEKSLGAMTIERDKWFELFRNEIGLKSATIKEVSTDNVFDKEKLNGRIAQLHMENILNDSELFRAWQANIAMAFVDEYSRSYKILDTATKRKIHVIANTAAVHFLNQLSPMVPVIDIVVNGTEVPACGKYLAYGDLVRMAFGSGADLSKPYSASYFTHNSNPKHITADESIKPTSDHVFHVTLTEPVFTGLPFSK